jgi:hypothetical protein
MNGDRVATEHIPTALSAGSFIYADGATKVFEPTVPPRTSSRGSRLEVSGICVPRTRRARLQNM